MDVRVKRERAYGAQADDDWRQPTRHGEGACARAAPMRPRVESRAERSANAHFISWLGLSFRGCVYDTTGLAATATTEAGVCLMKGIRKDRGPVGRRVYTRTT